MSRLLARTDVPYDLLGRWTRTSGVRSTDVMHVIGANDAT
jgi:NAD/NADP transhydrogenase beta subunit